MRFTDDLRLADNAALSWAARQGPVVALFVLESETNARPIGAAAAWWQRRSLEQLAESLHEHNVPLLIACGDPVTVVAHVAKRLAETVGLAGVTWNRRYHQPFREIDARIKSELHGAGIPVKSHPGCLLTEPWKIHTESGMPYKVFTPFARKTQQLLLDSPPDVLPTPNLQGASLPDEVFDDADYARFQSGFSGSTEPFWATETLATHCAPGENAANKKFETFLSGLESGGGYKERNDIPYPDATSGLSAHLRFGEISPAYVWSETVRFADEHPAAAADAWAFLRQLLWRDFAWHRLYHLPDMTTENVREQFDTFPWAWSGNAVPGASLSAFAHPGMESDEDAKQHLAELAAWQRGETGVPLVDAGMRELWATGTMHNRVRMVAGSWLTKNLGIHWRHGEEWFWDTLVDADYASNPFNWQWVAGSGDDAAPYFRIFNPYLQEEKFDPDGLYVNHWVPERHTPFYPEPMVDVKESRKAALAAYNDLRGSDGK